METMGADVGSQAIFGPAHHLDTVAGYTAYHAVGVLGLVVAVWGLLAATRLLRGEEQAGRWELLLAGQTTRRRATAAAIGGLGIGLLTLWAVTAAAAVVVGRSADARFTVSASLFMAVAAVAATGMFLARPPWPQACSGPPTCCEPSPPAAPRCGGSAGPARWAGSTSCIRSPAAARLRCCRSWAPPRRWPV